MTELRPCPFCGGEAEWSYLVPDGAIVGCKDAYSANPKCRIKPEIRRYRGDMEKSLEVALSDWNTRPNPWHTGTPTEEGWYLLHYPECKEQPYELAQWNGEHFVAVKPFHAIVVRIEASSVPYWQKIEER